MFLLSLFLDFVGFFLFFRWWVEVRANTGFVRQRPGTQVTLVAFISNHYGSALLLLHAVGDKGMKCDILDFVL